MTNKKFWLRILVMMLVFGLMVITLTGCATARGVMQIGDDFSAEVSESEIIILSLASMYQNSDLTITLDGQVKGILRGGGSAKFIVPNGQHILIVDWKGTGVSSDLYGRTMKGEPYEFTINSERFQFRPIIPPTWFQKVTLQLVNSTSLKPVQQE
jgi:predicted small secreted protein